MRKLILLSFCLIISLILSGQIEFDKQDDIIDRTLPSFTNAVVDMNGDFLDDFVRVGEIAMSIYYQKPEGGFEVKLFRQEFENIPFWSITAGDIDADGFNDLLFGGNRNVSIYKASSNGGFFTEQVYPDYIFCQRGSFADIDNDGHLDALMCNDVAENHPLRNEGDGNLVLDFDFFPTMKDVPGNYAVNWVDYDMDGDIDLYISKCVQQALPGDSSRTNLLYQNDGFGNYEEVASQLGLDDNDQSWVTLWEDFDLDGDFDAVIINHEVSNRFMRNDGGGIYVDIIDSLNIMQGPLGALEGITADFDNNGYMDILTDFPAEIHYNYGNFRFEKDSLDFYPGAIGDLNNDGFIDIINFSEVRYNRGNEHHWLRINLIGQESNRNAIGAKVYLYGEWGEQIREIRATQGYRGMHTLGVHYGIGESESIDSLVVKWPSGNETIMLNPSIDQVLNIDESGCNFQNPSLEIVGEQGLCPGEEVVLIAPAGFTEYIWSNGMTTEQVTITESGSYNVSFTDSDGCMQYSKVVDIINYEDPFKIYAPNGEEFCFGTPVNLQVDVEGEVRWSNGSTGNEIWTAVPGEYIATVTTPCGNEVLSEPIELIEAIVDLPVSEDAYVTRDSLFVELMVEGDNSALWYGSETGSDLIRVGFNLPISVSSLEGDTTFWVSNCRVIDSDKQCYSARVPVSIFLIENSNDLDGDGFEQGEDCDDNDPNVNPAAEEIAYNGIDDDCNPETLDDDLDRDGYPVAEDCNDVDPEIFPGQVEVCDGIDNNCDAQIDEGLTFVTYYEDNDGDGFGDSDLFVTSCTQLQGYVIQGEDCDDSNSYIYPGAEEIIGNGIDEDCDGEDLSSIQELDGQLISIYPNPTQNYLYFDYINMQPYLVEILDINGKRMFSSIIQEKIDLSSYPEGLYLIKVTDQRSKNFITEKIHKIN